MLSDNFTDSPFANMIYIGPIPKSPSMRCLHITKDFNCHQAICKEWENNIYLFY